MGVWEWCYKDDSGILMRSPRKVLLAHLLSIFVVITALTVGVIVGGWIPPTIAAYVTEHSVSEINLEWVIFPASPKWLDPVKDRGQIALLGFMSMIVGLACAVVLAKPVLRLNHHIMVNKLKWGTEEDARRSNENQWL